MGHTYINGDTYIFFVNQYDYLVLTDPSKDKFLTPPLLTLMLEMDIAINKTKMKFLKDTIVNKIQDWI